MIRLTVEETNLLSIYNEGGKRALIENVNAALPYMDADMRELAKRTLAGRKAQSRTPVLFRGNERHRDCGAVQHVEKHDTVQADKLF